MSDSITTTAGWIEILKTSYLQLFSPIAEAISGNLSFLNHMTIIPALACLDDACWTPWRSRVAPKPGADEQRKVAGR